MRTVRAILRAHERERQEWNVERARLVDALLEAVGHPQRHDRPAAPAAPDPDADLDLAVFPGETD